MVQTQSLMRMVGSETKLFLYSRGKMIDLGTLDGRNSSAYGINNSGQVVGWANINDNSGTQVFSIIGESELLRLP